MPRANGRGKYDRSQTASERELLRVEQLLDAATEVFATRGYAGTRVDDIVEAAGISRRTLYAQFASVEAILEEVYARAVRINFETIVQRLMAESDPVQRVHVGISAYYETIAAHPSAARVVFEEYRQAGPKQAATFELNTARYTLLMMEFLSAAHVAGRLGRAPDELSVYALLKGCEAIGIRALHRKELATLPAIAPVMARLILDAFR